MTACTGRTASGHPCKGRVRPGDSECWHHLPEATRDARRAAKRQLENARPAVRFIVKYFDELRKAESRLAEPDAHRTLAEARIREKVGCEEAKLRDAHDHRIATLIVGERLIELHQAVSRLGDITPGEVDLLSSEAKETLPTVEWLIASGWRDASEILPSIEWLIAGMTNPGDDVDEFLRGQP